MKPKVSPAVDTLSTGVSFVSEFCEVPHRYDTPVVSPPVSSKFADTLADTEPTSRGRPVRIRGEIASMDRLTSSETVPHKLVAVAVII